MSKGSEMVDRILLGEEIGSVLSGGDSVAVTAELVDKKLGNVVCPTCEEQGTFLVKEAESLGNNFFKVKVECTSCQKQEVLEIALNSDDAAYSISEGQVLPKEAFMAVTEAGLMVGNYFRFIPKAKPYAPKGEENVSFDTPAEGADVTFLNVKATYKVVSFRNNMAKVILMTNDNANKFKPGKVFYIPKADLQKYCKMSAMVKNPSMSQYA